MKFLRLASLVAITTISPRCIGQVEGRSDGRSCINLAANSEVSVRGILSLRHFPGPPNYENIKNGDADEAAFILVLPGTICLSDGTDGFADPTRRFRTVHIYGDTKQVQARLHENIGKLVTVRGDGFAAENGHHHAPLVIRASQVQRARAR